MANHAGEDDANDVGMQLQQDFIREWLPRRDDYINWLLEDEYRPMTARRCVVCEAPADWRCRGCLGHPSFCDVHCLSSHQNNPFHRVQYWKDDHYEDAWLFHLGLVVSLGHNGNPCPSYIQQNPSEGFPSSTVTGDDDDEDLAIDEDWEHMDDDTGDNPTEIIEEQVTKVQILKELRKQANIYGHPDGVAVPRPAHCIQMTAIDTSGVHKLWVKPCNCTGGENAMERHLLELRMVPASFEKPRTVFTFGVLNDFRLTNLECQASAYHYYKKLARITSPLMPAAVEVCITGHYRFILSFMNFTGSVQRANETKPDLEGHETAQMEGRAFAAKERLEHPEVMDIYHSVRAEGEGLSTNITVSGIYLPRSESI
jgi:hypothetical protein